MGILFNWIKLGAFIAYDAEINKVQHHVDRWPHWYLYVSTWPILVSHLEVLLTFSIHLRLHLESRAFDIDSIQEKRTDRWKYYL